MTLEWSDDPRAFASQTWARLHAADPEASVFHMPEYLKLYWEEFGGGLQVALVDEGGEPVTAAAFDLRDGVLTFLGGSDVTDYMGPVGRPEEVDQAAKELMAGIARRTDWQRGDLRGLLEEGRWLGALAEAASEAGLAFEVADGGIAPMLDLPASFDGYLAGLSARRRHEIRRKGRRLREALPDARLVETRPECLEADLDRFLEMHRLSEGRKGRFMRPGMELFFRRLADSLLPRGILRLMFLETDGAKIAGAIAFRWGNGLSLYNSAYDRSHASVAPGMVLLAEIISDAIASGFDRLDMLTGDLEYKYRFGARPRPVKRLLLARR